MIGITSFGAYIPYYRLPRETIAKAWGGGSQGGERSVANYDEDSLTMAVEAARDCLTGVDSTKLNAIYFASTTAPYREKLSASILAQVFDAPRQVRTADVANTLRSGTTAVLAALDALKAGSAKQALVTASDMRLGFPKSNEEQHFGDAAGALLLTSDDAAVTIDDAVSISNEMVDVWRRDRDTYVRTWEDRFISQHGYQDTLSEAVRALLQRNKLTAKEVGKAVLYSPDARSSGGLARGLGFDAATQLQDPLVSKVGNCGAASTFLQLVAALQAAKAGDRIVWASYGDGADALLLRVRKPVVSRAKGVKGWLDAKALLPTYERYLSFRGIMETTPDVPLRTLPWAAGTVEWRDRSQLLSLHGGKCRKCGTVHFPIQRVCYTCQAKDDYDEVCLWDKRGTVFSFTLDHLAGGLNPPVVETVVEMDESKARVYCQMTDVDPKDVKVGMPVEMTFRYFHEGADFHNYFWKCRPAR